MFAFGLHGIANFRQSRAINYQWRFSRELSLSSALHRRILVLLAALVTVTLALLHPVKAATPDDIMRRMADELTTAVRADAELQDPNSERMAEFMRKRVVPRFNFEMITRSVIGKNWLKASAQERRILVNQFSQLMIRTYAKAVARLKDFDVDVQSVKVITPNELVTVRTTMTAMPQSYVIDYDMKLENSGWRVHDITFQGISLVNSYRDEYTTLIANSGIEGLIAELEMKNSR